MYLSMRNRYDLFVYRLVVVASDIQKQSMRNRSEKLLQNLSQNGLLYFPKHDKSKESAVNAFMVFFGWYAAVHIYLTRRYCELQFIVAFGANLKSSYFAKAVIRITKNAPTAAGTCTQHDDGDND